jgi:hypothetical protein|tara:strand:- start:3785 stop:4186 length:402 start_codon:yes stop_codon:yes gene_type:complete
MEKDIQFFCENILPYLDECQHNLNIIISLMIRDIRTNDLIYVKKLNKWYEYNLYKKIWEKFDFNNILKQISTFDKFFNEHLKTYINQSNLNENNKLYFLKLSEKMVSFINKKSYNKNIICKECCKLFSVDKLI